MLTPLSLVSVLHAQSGELGISDLVAFSPAEASPLAWLAVPTLLAYWAGAIRLWQVGRGWSLGRTLLFTLGCVLWFLVCGLSLNAHANVLVSALLFQQITLMVVVPPFLLMGSPGRLLLSSVPHGGPGRWILRAALGGYRSRAAQLLLHPAAAIVIALLAFPGFYFSDGVSVVMATPGGHTLALLVFLLAGVIAGAPLWALDPLPRTPSYVVRLVDVVLEIQIHAIFGLILLLSTRSLFAWYAEDPPGWGMTRALDQAIAGGLIWSYGELPLLIVLIVTLSKWRTSDERRARRRRAEEDAELDEYNAYLAARYGTRTENVETDDSSASRL
ncbi:cytochrome c oxidase assembly protein [Leucobacter chromiireducens]|uniref:cytochrome c oxidase assembly protein n=1 Tax=Leucobacter chromiireducens TaxID=283877 RepID=UPI003075E154